jgi:hypothetical protein
MTLILVLGLIALITSLKFHNTFYSLKYIKNALMKLNSAMNGKKESDQLIVKKKRGKRLSWRFFNS